MLVEPAGQPGTWYLSAGDTSFEDYDPIIDPPHPGSGQYAVTGQTGASAYALISSALPVSVRMSLQLDYFVINLAPYATPTPYNLSSTTDPNQQARLPGAHDAPCAGPRSRRGRGSHAAVHSHRPRTDDVTPWR